MPEANEQNQAEQADAQNQSTESATSSGEQAASTAADGASAQDLLADLDLANLDLSVESVEERISPSETNVFDK